MGMFSEIDEQLAEARELDKQRETCRCPNPDTCPRCVAARIKAAELRGQTPDMSDVRYLKYVNGGW